MSSNRVLCLVQFHEKGVTNGRKKRLSAGIQKAYNEHVDASAKLKMIWVSLPDGQAWLAGHPSTATTLLTPVPDDISQEDRVALMGAICEDWMDVTKCSVDEIIVNAMSKSEAKRYFEVAQTRFYDKKALALKLKIAFSVLKTRLTKGYLGTSINMP